MKKRLTILTCFMVLCSFVFGQNHWTPNTDLPDGTNMTLTSVIVINGVEQTNTQLEIGAFYGDEVRGSAKLMHRYFEYNGQVIIDRYYAYQTILGVPGETYSFKLYDHATQQELQLVSNNAISFNQVTGDTETNPYVINFFTPVAEVDGVKYPTFEAAIAAVKENSTLTLLDDVTISEKINVTSNLTINGNGKILTYTGSGESARAIDVTKETNGANLTVKNLTIDCTASYCQRGINYNTNGTLVLEGVTVKGINLSYALNMPGSADNATVTISNSTLKGCIALNVWGENATINATNTTFTTVDNAEHEGYAAVKLNNDGTTSAEGSVINITGGSIKREGSYTSDSSAASNATSTGEINISDTTDVDGDVLEMVAVIIYGNNSYSFTTLEHAIAKAEAGEEIVVIKNITLESPITVPAGKEVVLDLNGNEIVYNSTTQNEAMITNKGTLTINDEVGTGVINYNYTGAADPSYGKGNYTISNGGTLTVNGGYITIANLSAHAKYPINNNSTTGDAILVIDGGHLYNYNTSAIRQFCNSDTYKNSVTINGGLIEGYSAIWMQNPGSKEVNGQLSINAGEIRTTAKAYVEGTSSISEVASKIYCTTEGGTWDEESAFVITGGTINENVYLGEESPASMTLYKEAQFNGYVEFDLSEGRELVHNGLSNVTVTKNITGDPVPQDNNEYVGGWYTISSPVGTVYHTEVVGLLNDTHDLYRYNEANAMWENVKANEDFTTLDAGRGYIYANTEDTELSFTGTLNTAAVKQKLSASHTELTGFNLIGNPFTYNITKSNMSGANLAVGFYTLSNHGAWQPKAEDATIAPMQGALIKVTEETDNFIIAPNSAKRSESENNGQIKIEVSNGNYNDVAYVSFNKGIGLDKIEHRNANIPMVYVPVDGVNYAVAMMSQDVTEIPVSFQAATMGQYTIGVEAQDCEYAMMTLVDRFTGIETNLLIEDYTFIAKSNDSAERFIIKLAMDNSNGEANENFAFINNGMMYIYNIEGQGTVSVYDVTGRPVAEYNVATSANISTSDFAAGMYIIRMSDENGVKVQKIVVE